MVVEVELASEDIKGSIMECRHKQGGATKAEVVSMVLAQFLLFLCLFLLFMHSWQLKVLKRARYYLNALPDRRILNYMKKENRAPFELEANPDLKESKS